MPDLRALQRTLENVCAGRDVRAGPGDGDLERMSRSELVERAKTEAISGPTKMSKKELVDVLEGR